MNAVLISFCAQVIDLFALWRTDLKRSIVKQHKPSKLKKIFLSRTNDVKKDVFICFKSNVKLHNVF